MIDSIDRYTPELWQELNAKDPIMYPLTVDNWRKIKAVEIVKSFNKEFINRAFTSSLGFLVDNRRSGSKFDKDNVKSLIDLGADPVQFKDADGVIHSLTQAELQTLHTEMIQDGLGLYQKKWTLEGQVEAATTIAELEAITW